MLSRLFILKNKICCGNGCLMCPYEPKHNEGSKLIRSNVINKLDKEEFLVLKNNYDM